MRRSAHRDPVAAVCLEHPLPAEVAQHHGLVALLHLGPRTVRLDRREGPDQQVLRGPEPH